MNDLYNPVPQRSDPKEADAMARALGWFSIGLGLAETLFPGTILRATGSQGSKTVVRTYGMREIANGLGILSAKDPTPWIWARVGGDAMDISSLAARGGGSGGALAFMAVAGVTALDIICAQNLREEQQRPRQPMRDYSKRSGFPRPPAQMRGASLGTMKPSPALASADALMSANT
jgi:hypothetical protein